MDTITYRTLVQRAWPIILANTAVPILGLVDTAIIGNVGNTEDLGAIALGALVYSFLFWSFGFLRMATTGFVAQAAGAGREDEIQAIVLRALLLALVLGIVLVIMQVPMAELVFHLFSASADVENTARDYFLLRVWSAPSTFATFALFGTLIGLGKSRVVLGMQLFLNGTNALLDIIFAGVLGWGVTGIAVGTMLAEWSTFLLGAFVVFNILRARNGGQIAKVGLAVVLEHKAILQTFIVNRDIFLRTLALVFAFAWFNNQSIMLGDVVLAANHILVQFIGFSAFFLDGYAMVAEAVVGSALGARRLTDFDCAVRRTTVLAAGTAALLAILQWLGGSFFYSCADQHRRSKRVGCAVSGYGGSIYPLVCLCIPAGWHIHWCLVLQTDERCAVVAGSRLPVGVGLADSCVWQYRLVVGLHHLCVAAGCDAAVVLSGTAPHFAGLMWFGDFRLVVLPAQNAIPAIV